MGQSKHLGLVEIQYKSTHIQHSKRRTGKRNEREQNLQEEYAKAKFTFETNPNDRNANILNSAIDTLELFYEEKVKEIIIRARERWYEHGEESTKYNFLI